MAELTQTYNAGRGSLASIPGASASPYPNLSPALIAALLARKQQMNQAAAAPKKMAAAEPEDYRPTYQPQFGSSPQQGDSGKDGDVVTRVVPDPFANPYGKLMTGLDAGSRVERGFKDKSGNIQWEFDSVRPRGSSGGIQGGGMSNPSELHSTSNLQQKMDAAFKTGSPAAGREGDDGPDEEQTHGGATQTDTGYTKALQKKQQAAFDARERQGYVMPRRFTAPMVMQ